MSIFNKIPEGREISKMSDNEIEEKVIDFMEKNCFPDSIKDYTLDNIEAGEYYNEDDDNYIITVDSFISDQAGRFITKEAIEFFGFVVDEKAYEKELEVYIDISDLILQIASLWINKRIKTLSGYYCFIINNDFKLNFVTNYTNKFLTSDFDYLTDYLEDRFMENKGKLLKYHDNRDMVEKLINKFKCISNSGDMTKKEVIEAILNIADEKLKDYIPKKAKKYFIEGIDCNIGENLASGYVSMWKNYRGNIVFIYSSYLIAENVYYYDFIRFNDMKEPKKDIIDEFKNSNSKEDILDYVGEYGENKEINYIENNSLCNIIHDMQQYSGHWFYNWQNAKNPYEILKGVIF